MVMIYVYSIYLFSCYTASLKMNENWHPQLSKHNVFDGLYGYNLVVVIYIYIYKTNMSVFVTVYIPSIKNLNTLSLA